MKHACKMQYQLDPIGLELPGDETGTVETPTEHQVRLETLAMLDILGATWRFSVLTTGQSASGEGIVRLYAADSELATQEFSLVNGSDPVRESFALDVALGNVAGQTPIKAELEITTAGDAVTVRAYSLLDVLTPFAWSELC